MKSCIRVPDTRWHDRFIEYLRQDYTVADACEACGIGRKTAYNHREDFPEFAEAWDEAKRNYTDRLEQSLKRRALNGLVREVRDKEGNVVCEETEYDNKLGMWLLERLRPEEYHLGHKLTVSGEIELTIEQRAERLKQVLPTLYAGLIPEDAARG